MTINTDHFKKLLEEERDKVEAELRSVGRQNPDNPEDWEPAIAPDKTEAMSADPNEEADRMEEFGENVGIVNELEGRYREILMALKRIDEGTYGTCSVSGEPIPEERLKANPAAATCIDHARAR